MRHRPSQTIRLSRVMRQLGWSNVRARGLNRGSYRDRVRGFAREAGGELPSRVIFLPSARRGELGGAGPFAMNLIVQPCPSARAPGMTVRGEVPAYGARRGR